MRSTLLLLTLLVASTGCRNSCQTLCVRMAAYADDCGLQVADADLSDCITDQADAEDKASCRQYGDARTLRERWSCEDVAVYFGRR